MTRLILALCLTEINKNSARLDTADSLHWLLKTKIIDSCKVETPENLEILWMWISYEPCHEQTCFISFGKTKLQISLCIRSLISTLVVLQRFSLNIYLFDKLYNMIQVHVQTKSLHGIWKEACKPAGFFLARQAALRKP